VNFWAPANETQLDQTYSIQPKRLRFSMSVQLDLLHGGHVQNLDTFNERFGDFQGMVFQENCGM